MSEKVLGVLQVAETVYEESGWSWSGPILERRLSREIIHEELIITSDRILVIRKWVQFPSARKTAESKRKMRERENQAKTLEELLKASNHNYAFPNSEITRVELKKGFLWGKSINIVTKGITFKYPLKGLNNQKKGVKMEDYENILRPVFGDKLSVKK